MHKFFHCGLHRVIQSKRLKKEKKKQRHTPRVNFFFLHKKYQKMLRSKNVRSFCKDIVKSLGSSCNA
jgi:hypothetical protein